MYPVVFLHTHTYSLQPAITLGLLMVILTPSTASTHRLELILLLNLLYKACSTATALDLRCLTIW